MVTLVLHILASPIRFKAHELITRVYVLFMQFARFYSKHSLANYGVAFISIGCRHYFGLGLSKLN